MCVYVCVFYIVKAPGPGTFKYVNRNALSMFKALNEDGK